MTDISKKDVTLDYILCIYYLIYFLKNKNNVKALINSTSKINVLTSIYILKFGF